MNGFITAYYSKGRMSGRDGWFINLPFQDAYFFLGTLTDAKKGFCLRYRIEKLSWVNWKLI